MRRSKINRISATALIIAGNVAAFEPVAGREMKREAEMTQGPTDAPARTLPFSHGRSFATLDAYLAHLRDYAGPVGQPWYREIRPGVYQLISTATPQGRPEIRTRAELMQQFGFTR